MPDDNAHAADDTRKLRARFPRWGIMFDPLESVWVAVRGKRTLVAASSPEKLTEQVEAAARGEAGPMRAPGPRRGGPCARTAGASGRGEQEGFPLDPGAAGTYRSSPARAGDDPGRAGG